MYVRRGISRNTDDLDWLAMCLTLVASYAMVIANLGFIKWTPR